MILPVTASTSPQKESVASATNASPSAAPLTTPRPLISTTSFGLGWSFIAEPPSRDCRADAGFRFRHNHLGTHHATGIVRLLESVGDDAPGGNSHVGRAGVAKYSSARRFDD